MSPLQGKKAPSLNKLEVAHGPQVVAHLTALDKFY